MSTDCMLLPLVYHEDYNPTFPAGQRFPMEKFRLLRDYPMNSGLYMAGEQSYENQPRKCLESVAVSRTAATEPGITDNGR